MTISLIGGGVRSGKSAFALARAKLHTGRRVFVATAEARDAEMRERIDRHVAERAGAFETVEAPRDLERIVIGMVCDVLVVDCITLWLSNLLCDGHSEGDIAARVDSLAGALAGAPFEAVLVTNEVGMGIVPETRLGRTFRDVAGRAHQRLARDASTIFFATMGCVLRLKPNPVVTYRTCSVTSSGDAE